MRRINLIILLCIVGSLVVNAEPEPEPEPEPAEGEDNPGSATEGGTAEGARKSLGRLKAPKDVYAKCKDKTKAICYGGEEGCIDKEDCIVMVAIEKDEKSENYRFYLMGKNKDKYAAVGLSNTNGGKAMKNTVLFVCNLKNDAKFGVFWSPEYKANSVPSDMVVGKPSVEETDSVQCEFEVKPKFTVEGGIDFQFDKNGYNILLAYGDVEGDKPKKHTEEARWLSTSKFKPADVAGGKSDSSSGSGDENSNSSASFVNTSFLTSVLLFTCTTIMILLY